MPRFDLSVRINQGEREELHGEIPDDEWAILLRFSDRFDRLAETRLAAGSALRLRMSFDADGTIRVSGELPPSDDVDAFIYRMRPFVLKDEPTFFYRVCNIIGHRIPHPAHALIVQQRDVFSGRDFQSQIQLSSNGTIINDDETLRSWLNAVGEYHSDQEKEAALRQIHAPIPLESIRPLFISMMFDKAKAVGEIATAVKIIVKRGERGSEVRFGDLRVER